MNVYIWMRIEKLTDQYHEGGGLLVVAKSLDRARELVPDKVDKRTLGKPDLILPLVEGAGKALEQRIIFPDSGCC